MKFPFLVGGFSPVEKNISQIGSFPQVGVKTKIVETTNQFCIAPFSGGYQHLRIHDLQRRNRFGWAARAAAFGFARPGRSAC